MDKSSSEVLKPEWVKEYQEHLDALWFQSVSLNANIYLLRRISEFPWHWSPPNESLCWSLISDALYHNSVMTIWRMVCDVDKDVLSVRKLRASIMRNVRDDEARNYITARLKELKFDERARSAQAVEQVRNEWIAHIHRKSSATLLAQGMGTPRVPAETLYGLADAVHELIEALSFDSGRATSYDGYDKYSTMSSRDRTDFERVLDMIAANHPVINMPEEQPDFWQDYKLGMTGSDRALFNMYRCRSGLPAVSWSD